MFESLEQRRLLSAVMAMDVAPPMGTLSDPVVAMNHHPSPPPGPDDPDPDPQPEIDCGETLDCKDDGEGGHWEYTPGEPWIIKDFLNEPGEDLLAEKLYELDGNEPPGAEAIAVQWFAVHEWELAASNEGTYGQKVCLNYSVTYTTQRTMQAQVGGEAYGIGISISESKTEGAGETCDFDQVVAGPDCGEAWKIELYLKKSKLVKREGYFDVHANNGRGGFMHQYTETVEDTGGYSPCNYEIVKRVKERMWVSDGLDPVEPPPAPLTNGSYVPLEVLPPSVFVGGFSQAKELREDLIGFFRSEDALDQFASLQ